MWSCPANDSAVSGKKVSGAARLSILSILWSCPTRYPPLSVGLRGCAGSFLDQFSSAVDPRDQRSAASYFRRHLL